MNLLPANSISRKCPYSIRKSFYIRYQSLMTDKYFMSLPGPGRTLQSLRNTAPGWGNHYFIFLLFFNGQFNRIICYIGSSYIQDTLNRQDSPTPAHISQVHTDIVISSSPLLSSWSSSSLSSSSSSSPPPHDPLGITWQWWSEYKASNIVYPGFITVVEAAE